MENRINFLNIICSLLYKKFKNINFFILFIHDSLKFNINNKQNLNIITYIKNIIILIRYNIKISLYIYYAKN